jgi:Ca-activated chloride channel family protein
MADEFDYMVTPLVFDLQLKFASAGYAIDAVYGSPEADQGSGILMKVNTLFPSKVEKGETKGGLIVLKLKKTGSSAQIKLTASYKDRTGQCFSSNATFSFKATPDSAPNSGIRKGIVLSRYVRLIKQWIEAERKTAKNTDNSGLSPWERKSVPLTVSAEHQQLFQKFLGHMKAEASAIQDQNLEQEIKILEKLSQGS